MKNQLTIVLSLAVGLIFPTVATAQGSESRYVKNRPLVFIENKGQVKDQYGNPRTDIDFSMKGGAVQVFVGEGKIHYQWYKSVGAEQPTSFMDLLKPGNNQALTAVEAYRMDVRLLGADKGVLTRSNPNVYRERYYTDAADGVIASSYEKLIYQNVYPNIDWVLYSKDGKMEYDFVVRPGGKVSDIQLEYSGTTDLRIQDDGSLLAATPFGSVTEAAPYSFQGDGSVVASSFVLKGNRLGFSTGVYKGKLTIDPVVSWGTYFGGDWLFDTANDMAVVPNGGAVLAGHATSTVNIATVGAHQTTISGNEDGYIAKFSTSGTLLWSTYYGGPSADDAKNVALDSLGNIYASGSTSSPSGIATPGSHQSVAGGGNDNFVVKFDSTGSRIFGTYYGGPQNEGAHTSIALRGNYFYIAGNTESATGIATAGTHQSVLNGMDAYVAKFNLDGVRQWATYYGGEGGEGFLSSVDADHNGNVYLFGTTNSIASMATPGAHQPNKADPSAADDDYFLVKFDENGQRQWGTYYGGALKEAGNFSSRNVQCDELGNVYIVGITLSTDNIAGSGSFQSTIGGDHDAFLAKFNSAGVRQWATYLGGSEMEQFSALKVVNSNLVYVCMASASSNTFTTADAIQPAFAGGAVYGDAYIASFDGNGNPIYASYFGGDGIECTGAIGVDDQGYVYLTGISNSLTGIATPNTHMSSYPGTLVWCSFLTRFCFAPIATATPIIGPDTVCRYAEVTYSTTAVAEATSYIWSLPDGWSGTSTTNTINVTTSDMGGAIGVSVVRCGDTSELVSMPVTVRAADPATLTYENGVLTANGDYTGYSWVKNGQVIPSTNFPSVSISEDGEYQVITVNAFGCTDTSEVFVVEGVHTNELSRLSQAIRIFPNPAQELVHIQSPVAVHAQITTIEGRVLMPANAANSISLQSLSPGMYLVRITTPDGKLLKSEKLVKMR